MVDTKTWRDNEMTDKANQLHDRGTMDRTLGLLALSVLDSRAAFDAGFEYGVLATEAGVGRAPEA